MWIAKFERRWRPNSFSKFILLYFFTFFLTSFSTFLFCFQFELMCEVHLPKSKHNSFQLIIFDLDKIDSVLQMQFIWKDQFVIVYRPQLYLV